MPGNSAIHKFKARDKFHDRYTLEKLICVDSVSEKWEADDMVTNCKVALEIFVPDYNNQIFGNLISRYEKWSKLRHENIIEIYDARKWNYTPYLVTKRYDGLLVGKVGKINLTELKQVIIDIANGLLFLHNHSIIHRNIKPSNIFYYEQRGKIKYALGGFDFGSLYNHNKDFLPSHFSEQVYCLPPECFNRNREVRYLRPENDVFSLGLTIYELVLGDLPFDTPKGLELLLGGPEIDFSVIKDRKVKQLVSQCMQKDPQARPTMEEIIEMVSSEEFKLDCKRINFLRRIINRIQNYN